MVRIFDRKVETSISENVSRFTSISANVSRILGLICGRIDFFYVVIRNMLEAIDAEWDVVVCRETCVADEHHRWSALYFVASEMHEVERHEDKSLKVCLSGTNRWL